MLREDYRKAHKMGTAQYKKSISRGEDPYPIVLDEMLENEKTQGESKLGVQEIPVGLIVGTKTKGRQNSFSKEFFPLLEEESEFAAKWMNLLKSQMEEGFRDPITVYEYRNRFYVLEGNKRVSITRYLKMPSILANVTRILPKKENTAEYRNYSEFLRFYGKTGMYDILFSRPGSYERLNREVGKSEEDPWSTEDIRDLKSVFYQFSRIYSEISGEQSPEVVGDAFLRALTIFPYEEMRSQSTKELDKEVKTIQKELEPDALQKRSVHVMEPEEKTSNPATLISKVLPTTKKVLKAAFLYDRNTKDSEWTYSHELGREYVQSHMGDGVHTISYQDINTEQLAEERIEALIEEGYQVIFTTSPRLMKASLKYAVRCPEVHFLNCSLDFPYKTVRTYYARLYEARFLLGLIAGVMCQGETIGYEADYPIYGTTANINAFAIGVQMVCPQAKIRLHWSSVRDGEQQPEMDERIVIVRNSMSNRGYDRPYGLFLRQDSGWSELATAEIHWGKFYRNILESINEGTWKKMEKASQPVNYWWGFSADVLDLICAPDLPEGTKKLAEEFVHFLASGEYHPFRGVLTDQHGARHGNKDEVPDSQEIATMDWLLENVEGEIPPKSKLSDPAQELVSLQGILEETP